MRTIYITFITLIFSLNSFAQLSCDTTYSKEWNESNHEWVYFDRIISAYDSEVLISELVQVFEYNDWVNYNMRNYFYNNGNVIVEIEKYWDDRHQEWIDNYRKLFAYDELGKLLTITHQNIFNGNYFNSSREVMEYNKEGQLIEKSVQTYEEAWTNFLKYQYYYNTKDLLFEENLTYWENDHWGDVSFALNYKYDKTNNLIEKVKTKKNGNGLTNLVREEFVYNDNSQLEEQVVSKWNQSKKNWTNKNRSLYVSNMNGFVCSLMNQNKDKKEWINYLFTEFKGTNEPITGLEVAEGMTFTVYPVNFGRQAKIEFNNPYNEEYFVRIVNADGQLMGSATTNDNEVAIDARQFIKGIYFIELQGSNLFSGKFSIK